MKYTSKDMEQMRNQAYKEGINEIMGSILTALVGCGLLVLLSAIII